MPELFKAYSPGNVSVMPVYAPASVKLTRLREWRRRRALTQRELAEKAGISKVTVSRIETGLEEPHISTIRSLAAALNVRADQLMPPAADK